MMQTFSKIWKSVDMNTVCKHCVKWNERKCKVSLKPGKVGHIASTKWDTYDKIFTKSHILRSNQDNTVSWNVFLPENTYINYPTSIQYLKTSEKTWPIGSKVFPYSSSDSNTPFFTEPLILETNLFSTVFFLCR